MRDGLYAAAGEAFRLVRMVRGVRGSMRMRMDLAIRFDYGRTVPWVTKTEQLAARDCRAGHDGAADEGAKLRGEGMSTVCEFMLRKGESVSFT